MFAFLGMVMCSSSSSQVRSNVTITYQITKCSLAQQVLEDALTLTSWLVLPGNLRTTVPWSFHLVLLYVLRGMLHLYLDVA